MLSIVSNAKGICKVLSRRLFAFETAVLSEILVSVGGDEPPAERRFLASYVPVQRDITTESLYIARSLDTIRAQGKRKKERDSPKDEVICISRHLDAGGGSARYANLNSPLTGKLVKLPCFSAIKPGITCTRSASSPLHSVYIDLLCSHILPASRAVS